MRITGCSVTACRLVIMIAVSGSGLTFENGRLAWFALTTIARGRKKTPAHLRLIPGILNLSENTVFVGENIVVALG